MLKCLFPWLKVVVACSGMSGCQEHHPGVFSSSTRAGRVVTYGIVLSGLKIQGKVNRKKKVKKIKAHKFGTKVNNAEHTALLSSLKQALSVSQHTLQLPGHYLWYAKSMQWTSS